MGTVRIDGVAPNAMLYRPSDLAKFAKWRQLVRTRQSAGFERNFISAMDRALDLYLAEHGPQGVKLAQGQVADLEGEVDRLLKLAAEQDAPRRRPDRGTVDTKPSKTATSTTDNETEVERLSRMANDLPTTS